MAFGVLMAWPLTPCRCKLSANVPGGLGSNYSSVRCLGRRAVRSPGDNNATRSPIKKKKLGAPIAREAEAECDSELKLRCVFGRSAGPPEQKPDVNALLLLCRLVRGAPGKERLCRPLQRGLH